MRLPNQLSTYAISLILASSFAMAVMVALSTMAPR